MKKFTSFLISTLLVTTAFAHASDTNSTYVLLQGGYSKSANKDKALSNLANVANLKSKKSASSTFAVGVGYKFAPNFRSDFTVNYLANQTSKYSTLGVKSTTKATAGIINAYYDVAAFGDIFTPYIGAGVGYGKLNYKTNVPNTTKSKSKGALVYQASLGTLVKVSDNLNLKVGYQYLALGTVKATKLDTNTQAKYKVAQHQAVAGLQFSL